MPSTVLHGVGAGVAGGVRVRRVVHRDTADDVFSLLGDSAERERNQNGEKAVKSDTERELQNPAL